VRAVGTRRGFRKLVNDLTRYPPPPKDLAYHIAPYNIDTRIQFSISQKHGACSRAQWRRERRPVPPAAYWRTIQIPRISAQDGESARPLRGARLAKESGGSATTLLSGRGIGGSAAMLPNAPFWKRHGVECCESEGTVSVSMCHARGQFLTNADLFDPCDHLTYIII
jgi:hypothetical protein